MHQVFCLNFKHHAYCQLYEQYVSSNPVSSTIRIFQINCSPYRNILSQIYNIFVYICPIIKILTTFLQISRRISSHWKFPIRIYKTIYSSTHLVEYKCVKCSINPLQSKSEPQSPFNQILTINVNRYIEFKISQRYVVYRNKIILNWRLNFYTILYLPF